MKTLIFSIFPLLSSYSTKFCLPSVQHEWCSKWHSKRSPKVLFLKVQYFCKFSGLRYIPTQIYEIQDMCKYKSASKLHLNNTAIFFIEEDYPSLMAIFMRYQLPLCCVLVSSYCRLCLAVMCLRSFRSCTEPLHWWRTVEVFVCTGSSGSRKLQSGFLHGKMLVNTAIPYS